MRRWIAAMSALVFLAPAAGQDPVKAEPGIYKTLLENDVVRVVEAKLPKGGKSAMHSHPTYVAYLMSDGKVKFTGPDGQSAEVEAKKGSAMWRDAESHAVENLGDGELGVVHFELKDSKAEIKPAEGDDAVKLSPDTHKVLLDNDRVRVVEVRAKPGERVPMHGHPDSAMYFLTDAKVRFMLPDRSHQEVEQKKGQAMWSPALRHAAEVIGDQEAALVRVELKPPKKK